MKDKVLSVLPVGTTHPYLHKSILERYKTNQERRNRLVKPYDPSGYKGFIKPTLRAVKALHGQPMLLSAIYAAVVGSENPHALNKVYIINALQELGTCGFVQIMTIEIKTPYTKFTYIEDRQAPHGIWKKVSTTGYHLSPMTHFAYVNQKRGPKPRPTGEGILAKASERMYRASRKDKESSKTIR